VFPLVLRCPKTNESRLWRSPLSTSLNFGNWRDTSWTREVSSRIGIRSCIKKDLRCSHGSLEGIWNSQCKMRSSVGSYPLWDDIRFVQDQRTKGACGLQHYKCCRRCPQGRNGRHHFESEIQGRTIELPMPGIKKNKSSEGESEKWAMAAERRCFVNVTRRLTPYLLNNNMTFQPSPLCSPLELSSPSTALFPLLIRRNKMSGLFLSQKLSCHVPVSSLSLCQMLPCNGRLCPSITT